jgi:hypothetical protein
MKLATLVALSLFAGPLWAADLQPKLEAAGLSVREADGIEPRPGATDAARKKVSLRAGKKTALRWSLSCKGSTEHADTLVHFYVVKAERAGQAAIREAKPADIILENAMTVDFHPGEDARGEIDLVIEQPGIYMARVEALGGGESLVSCTIDIEVSR